MKTNKELLAEIDRCENELRTQYRLKDELSKKLQFMEGHAISQNTEILWLKRIIEGLVSAPSVVTRPR